MGGDSYSDEYFMRSSKGVQFGAQALELAKAQAAVMAMSPKDSVFARVKSPIDALF